MRIAIVAPTSEPSLADKVTGNQVTARRWEEMLNKLGHDVTLSGHYDGEPVDVLVALHARKSAASIANFAKAYPGKPLVVALTGTDLYQDLPDSVEAAASLASATHVVALQPGALDTLDAFDPSLRAQTTVIYQSAKSIVPALTKASNCFQACLIAHLRPVKDPLLVVDAMAHLPETSQIQIVHAGAAGSDALGDRAKAAARDNPRYRWIGPLLHEESRLLIARSHVLVLTSRLEGGANVLSEALALGAPIVTSRAAGVEGLLGEDYPGYFPVGDASGLAQLLVQAEHDEVFYRRLQRACDKLAPLVLPANEMRTWHQLLSSFDA